MGIGEEGRKGRGKRGKREGDRNGRAKVGGSRLSVCCVRQEGLAEEKAGALDEREKRNKASEERCEAGTRRTWTERKGGPAKRRCGRGAREQGQAVHRLAKEGRGRKGRRRCGMREANG